MNISEYYGQYPGSPCDEKVVCAQQTEAEGHGFMLYHGAWDCGENEDASQRVPGRNEMEVVEVPFPDLQRDGS